MILYKKESFYAQLRNSCTIKFTIDENVPNIERAERNIPSHVWESNKSIFIASDGNFFSVTNKARYISWWALIYQLFAC